MLVEESDCRDSEICGHQAEGCSAESPFELCLCDYGVDRGLSRDSIIYPSSFCVRVDIVPAD